MSFRKRGEIVGRTSGPLPQRTPQAVQRDPTGVISGRGRSSPVSGGSDVPGRGPLPNRGGPVPGMPSRGMPRGMPRGIPGGVPFKGAGAHKSATATHPGIKPSLLNSEPCTSTGSADIDRVLEHGGLRLGCSLLVEEDGATDFSSTLLKLFIAQGVIYSRTGSDKNTHCIVVGPPPEWSTSLPGLYKGSSKERKRKALEENRKRVSVTNVMDQQQQQKQQQMKIAWRYGLQKKVESAPSSSDSSAYPDYNSQFDITSSMVPAANATELTAIPLSGSYQSIVGRIEATIRKHSDRQIRIALPLFLNPMLYAESEYLEPRNIVRFLFGLKALLKKYADRCVAMVSLNLDIYPRSDPLVSIIESSLVDGVIELRPFDPQLYEYLERVYRKEPAKLKHGHLNVYKLPDLSDTGAMCVKEMELSFKNGKKRFEVEQWSIPVDEEETVEEDVKPSPASLEF